MDWIQTQMEVSMSESDRMRKKMKRKKRQSLNWHEECEEKWDSKIRVLIWIWLIQMAKGFFFPRKKKVRLAPFRLLECSKFLFNWNDWDVK